VVSAIADEEPTEMVTLYDWVDPDALDRLFEPDECGETPSPLRTTFRYREYAVTVRGDGVVAVQSVER